MLYSIRIKILLSLALVLPAGLSCKWYNGPLAWWLNDYVAGVLYEVFWILVLFFWCPYRCWHGRLALGVFTATSILEVLQLWQPEYLEIIRSTFLGKTVLGATFSWWDFPHYILGVWMGWWWIRHLSSK